MPGPVMGLAGAIGGANAGCVSWETEAERLGDCECGWEVGISTRKSIGRQARDSRMRGSLQLRVKGNR